MPRGGYSFRILSPDPFDFSQPFASPLELALAVECPTKSKAIQLMEKILQATRPRQIRLVNGFAPSVSWTLSYSQALRLPKVLASWGDLSFQINQGLKGYVRQSGWELKVGGARRFRWSGKTQLMGILNVTPDSFSDGGRYLDPALAVDRALQMQEEGADWIDVGGESSRPGSKPVPLSEEKKRVLPVIKACAKVLRIPVSVDTTKSKVGEAAVGAGARMVNDISALRFDPRMGPTLARLKVPVVLMHMRGKPKTMQKKPVYRDILGEILGFFRERVHYAEKCGVGADRIVLDPGFGFGKTPWHNLEIIRRLWELKVLDRPLLMGPSRKSTLGVLLGGAPPEERVEGTAAAVTASILKGTDLIRVHDVKAMVRVVKIADALRYNRGITEA